MFNKKKKIIYVSMYYPIKNTNITKYFNIIKSVKIKPCIKYIFNYKQEDCHRYRLWLMI